MARNEVSAKVQNVVASATLGQDVDLNTILRVFPDTQYRPETFPGLIFRLKKPRATALIFRSGKMVCVGTRSERQCKRAVNNIVDELKNSGIIILRKPSIEIQNIVATAALGGYIDLEKTTYALAKTIYDPEQFPGLIHHMDEPKVVVLIFANGKLVLTGAKKEEELYRATTKLQETLEQENLIDYEHQGGMG